MAKLNSQQLIKAFKRMFPKLDEDVIVELLEKLEEMEDIGTDFERFQKRSSGRNLNSKKPRHFLDTILK